MPSLSLVAGLGKTGHSIARYLRRRNKSFVLFDTREQPVGLAEFCDEFPGIDVFLGAFPSALLDSLTEIISSPGVSLDEPFLQEASAKGIPIIGDIECFAREVKAPIVAITGTNGKSTVTTLVGEMAKASGISVAVAGNIGVPVLDLLDDDLSYDLWVLELSSFQLDLTTSLTSEAATILNITPDHLDRHHTIAAYIKSKQKVYHQARFLLYNREDVQTVPMSAFVRDAQTIANFGLDAPSVGNWGLVEWEQSFHLAFGSERILPLEALRIKGRHNVQNALAACALAHTIGISFEDMRVVLQRFSGLSHRSPWVRTIDGGDWINDSKGTNIGATVSAISGIGGSMQGKIVLIAGGQGKGADFTELRLPMADYVRSVVLIGEDADKIEHAIAGVVHVVRASTLEAAVIEAQSQAKPGDVVLLSPACASLDMFRDFNHRGDSFTAAVNAL